MASFVYLSELPSAIHGVQIVDWDDDRGGALITTCKLDCNGCVDSSEVAERLSKVIEYLTKYPKVKCPPYVITIIPRTGFKVNKLHMGNGSRLSIAPYQNPYTHETVREKTTVFVTGVFE
jgi:hypothetical protein